MSRLESTDAQLSDVSSRSLRATSVLLNGLWEGATQDAAAQMQHPEQLSGEALNLVKNGGLGKLAGLGIKLCPPVAVAATGASLWGFANDTMPVLEKAIPDLQGLWWDAYNEDSPGKLNYYQTQIGAKYGHEALRLTANGAMALVGLGCGLKSGSLLKARHGSEQRCESALRGSFQRSGRALGISDLAHGPKDPDLLKKIRAAATHVSTDEYGTLRRNLPNNAYSAVYADGTKFYRSPKGHTETFYPSGEKSTEIPGVMRIIDKPNGDKIFKYHQDGTVVTFRKGGSIVKEHPSGLVEETWRGKTYFSRPPQKPLDGI